MVNTNKLPGQQAELVLKPPVFLMGVRNIAAGREIKEAILKEIPDAKVDAMELDLSSLVSVKNFASEFILSGRPLNILINNAGIIGTPFKLSEDNVELHFATNHLGHFLLTNLLLDTMKKTYQATKKEGRIVNVSSVAHRYVYHLRFDRINDPTGYFGYSAYCESKIANVLHANEVARRLKIFSIAWVNLCLKTFNKELQQLIQGHGRGFGKETLGL